jgi:hypothetical protein
MCIDILWKKNRLFGELYDEIKIAGAQAIIENYSKDEKAAKENGQFSRTKCNS